MHLDLYHLMGRALKEAEKASLSGEVPVGAVIVSQDGEIVASGHNQPIALNDPTAHAEILAIRKASLTCRNYRLNNTVLVVTIEPCIMCMGAVVNARVPKLVYGADDPKGGAAGSLYDLAIDGRLNHRIEVISGIRDEECRVLMQDFFRIRRARRS